MDLKVFTLQQYADLRGVGKQAIWKALKLEQKHLLPGIERIEKTPAATLLYVDLKKFYQNSVK